MVLIENKFQTKSTKLILCVIASMCLSYNNLVSVNPNMSVSHLFIFLAQSNVTDSVLEVVAHEARRLFRDRLVSSKDLHTFDNILSSIIRGDWGSDALDNMTGMR